MSVFDYSLEVAEVAVLNIAYVDIRLAQSSSLLQELDALQQNCDASKDSDM
jgi:hypothetical protein